MSRIPLGAAEAAFFAVERPGKSPGRSEVNFRRPAQVFQREQTRERAQEVCDRNPGVGPQASLVSLHLGKEVDRALPRAIVQGAQNPQRPNRRSRRVRSGPFAGSNLAESAFRTSLRPQEGHDLVALCWFLANELMTEQHEKRVVCAAGDAFGTLGISPVGPPQFFQGGGYGVPPAGVDM